MGSPVIAEADVAAADEADVEVVPVLEAATSETVASALASEKRLVLVLEAASEATVRQFEPAIRRGARRAGRAAVRVLNPRQLRDRQRRSKV